MKIFVIEEDAVPIRFFIDKKEAYSWAFINYESLSPNTSVVAYVPVDTSVINKVPV